MQKRRASVLQMKDVVVVVATYQVTTKYRRASAAAWKTKVFEMIGISEKGELNMKKLR